MYAFNGMGFFFVLIDSTRDGVHCLPQRPIAGGVEVFFIKISSVMCIIYL